jgi:hypothetical protein
MSPEAPGLSIRQAAPPESFSFFIVPVKLLGFIIIALSWHMVAKLIGQAWVIAEKHMDGKAGSAFSNNQDVSPRRNRN